MANEIKDFLSYNWDVTNKRYKNFTDLGNYMILIDELKECDIDEIFETVRVFSGEPAKACTSCAKIADNKDMLVGRNMDIDARQFPTILAPTSFGKYKTINISYMFNGPWKYKDILTEGELNEYYARAVPFAATDVFNEKGLYIETNMRVPSDDFPFVSTNPGKKKASWTLIPALACAYCATVDEAMQYIKNSYDYYIFNNEASGMMGWNYAFLMADASGKYGVLESFNGELHFTPYQYGQANYYLNPTASAKELYGGGYGRLEFINKRLFIPQTKEDMLELMSKIFFSKEVLYPGNSFKDDAGKIHFVDDKGNEICDWRSDYSQNIFIYDDGSVHGFSDVQSKEEAYCKARLVGDLDGMKANESFHEKFEQERNRVTTAWALNDKNFEALQKAVVEKNATNISAMEEYCKGNEDPLRDNGHVWTSSISLGINCTDRSFILKMWEKDNVKITFKWQ